MRNTYFLSAIIVLSLSWIIFVTFDIVTKENRVDLTQYFSNEDGKIVVIHHPTEVNWLENNLQVLPENKQIFQSFQNKTPKNTSIFISEKRSILVIEKSEKWRKDEIYALFSSGIFPFDFEGVNQFKFGNYKGIVSSNQILLHKLDALIPSGKSLKPDKKSSYSLIYWNDENLTYEDIYSKKDKIITYKRYSNNLLLKQAVDDKQKFSGIIPANFDQYTFYSLEQFSQIDPQFKFSIFHQIINEGFVSIKKGNQQAILFDFKENQLPIQSLNEHFNREEKNEDFAEFDSLTFSKFLDTSNRRVYVAQFQEFGLISFDKLYFDALVTDINLGNSLSIDTKKMDELFGDLPLQVSMRVVDSVNTFSKTYIGNQTIETSVKRKSMLCEDDMRDVTDYFSMNPGENVLGFGTFDERGNSIVYTSNNQLHGYINGLKKWSTDISEIPMGIDLSIDRKYLLVHFSNETWVYQKNGGLKIKIPKTPEIRPVIANIRGVDYAFTVSGQSFIEFKLDGSVNKQFNGIEPIREIVFLKEAGNEKLILLGTNSFLTYYIQSKRAPKKTSTNKSFTSIGGNGNSWFTSQAANSVSWLNVSTGQIQSLSMPNLKIHDVLVTPSGNALVVSSNKSIQTILMNGQLLWKQTYDGADISKIVSGFKTNGNSILCLLDAIQNQCFVLDQSGKWITNNSIHAEKEIKINTFGVDGYSISTFLGSYLIQYNR